LQLLAVLGIPQTRKALFEKARALRLTDAKGRAFLAKDIGVMLEQAHKARWLACARDEFECQPDYALLAFKVAVLSGQLARWCDPLLQNLGVLDLHHHLLPNAFWEERFACAVRIAAFSQRKELLQQVLQAHWDQHPARLAYSLSGYVDAELLGTFESSAAEALAVQLLEHGFEAPHITTRSVYDWALLRAGAGPVSLQLRLVLIQNLLWRMRFEQAAGMAGDNALLAALVQAHTAAMQGHYVQSLPHFAAAAAALPSDAEGKRGRLPAMSAWLHVAAMIACDAPEQLEAAAKLCRKLSKSAAERWFWNSLQVVITARSGESQRPAWFTISGASLLDDLTQAIAYAWLRQRPDSHGRVIIENWVRLCESVGYLWPGRELRACLAIWDKRQPALSLAGAFEQEQTWQRALTAIAALQSGPEPEASVETRIAWRVRLAEGDIVERIEPWEQKRSSRGWTAARRSRSAAWCVMRTWSRSMHP
jgi:hypothetical protein